MGGAHDAGIEKRYKHTQGLLNVAQAENEKLKKVLEEMNRKLRDAGSNESGSEQKDEQIKDLKDRLDQAMRVAVKKKKIAEKSESRLKALEAQVERVKSENPDLAEKLNVQDTGEPGEDTEGSDEKKAG